MMKYVYSFNEGDQSMKGLLGGKGANLAEMTRIGLPVPPGFTVTTETCNEYYTKGEKLWPELETEIFQQLAYIEEVTGKKFGDHHRPLLVSVRSGAVVSMPGMMDTILNLGLNDASVIGMAAATKNERFAYDSYRRFIQMFGDVVLGIEKYKFDTLLEKRKLDKGIEQDTDLTTEDLQYLVEAFQKIVLRESKMSFPQDVRVQLLMSVEAVFKSWNNPRANVYRKLNDIPKSLGTAVNIQSMVFGNMGETSGTGVAFTRNPSTGEKLLYGEFLMNAQGEDVVAGIRTPRVIQELGDKMPEVYQEFVDVADLLEAHYKDMQDIEFTIENSKLYLLQTRNGKRTAAAAINIAVEMVGEGVLTKKEAIMRVKPSQLDQLLHPTFDEKALNVATLITKGLPASSGAATGQVYFNGEDVVRINSAGGKAILVRQETSPEDIEGMVASQGILTARGGMTSHAAVVARGMGKCCIAGAGEVRIDEGQKYFKVGNQRYEEGQWISLDGNIGNVYEGKVPTKEPKLIGNFGVLMEWADQFRQLKIRANADTPRDTRQAIKFGAEGIGLCRTEHMFFEGTRINTVRKMIVANNIKDRQRALDQLLPMQKADFIEIFKEMGDRPVTVRLLDPPLHEFLPHGDEDIKELAQALEMTYQSLKEVVSDLKEFNPMLGHRGCRLAVTYPEIYEMQVKAIIEAAIEVKEQHGYNIVPEIMIPLIGEIKELQYIKNVIIKVIDGVIEEKNADLKYLIGTMIEVPRAAITADEIAEEAEFFSFGTNDLTQMTYGFSRDDAGRFISEYREKNILDHDPFQRIDRRGVGRLMEIAVELGRKVKPELKIGICGEHGGDPDSIDLCQELGLDYVSCSPYRVPIARLAAAQSVIKNKDQSKE
ncbi:pyruvate, phosphate dikinase [Alkaliphilus metalliredigens QYMF]|uniref:Pyruvate, phosphate dikinase n=1 Tax=Alkaliphilus metalliredigens (strain QYMF) TaxID=293826 RepID=A6TSJ1_ALKMQ|nr:pyruvate, phosphate dikinase [Alkaliphilus metalliredigens]ABR49159.1 pyruvate, phosphate dikinase [Alkaliphilus metalliredigens QYMF]